MDNTLSRIYYNPSHEAGYSGARRLLLFNENGASRDDICKWLAAQDTYSLHKKVVRRFPRLHYNVRGIDWLWEADLTDLSSLKQYNDNYCFLLFVIDVLSKYLWIEPLRDKTSQSVTIAFKTIFERSGNRRPDTIQTDRGGEFMGRHTLNYLHSIDIEHREAANPDIKCSIVERVQRTVKERMWRYFTHQNTKRYINVLQDIVDGYNKSYHTSIKMKPIDVTYANATVAWRNIQSRQKIWKKKKPKYSCSDLVRISRSKGTFEKGYTANFSEEIFKIKKVLKHRTPVVYILEDFNGEEIDSIFYESELSAVSIPDENRAWHVNEILRSSGKGSKKKYFVSWVGWPKKFNSWVLASDIQQL